MTTSIPTRTVAVEQVSRPTPAVVIPGLGNFVNTFAIAGSSTANELTLTITGFRLTVPQPATILVQPRQSDNRELEFPDEFAVQVIETATDRIVVRIKRLDEGGGWGQLLRLDILIIDQVHNP
jgi:hypothetical protein